MKAWEKARRDHDRERDRLNYKFARKRNYENQKHSALMVSMLCAALTGKEVPVVEPQLIR